MLHTLFLLKIMVLSSFFSIIYKDIIFLFNYYEKLKQNIVCKDVADVAHIVFTGITAVLDVAMIINDLQLQKSNKHIVNQLIKISKFHFSKMSLKMLLRCCKVQHLKTKMLRFNSMVYNNLQTPATSKNQDVAPCNLLSINMLQGYFSQSATSFESSRTKISKINF